MTRSISMSKVDEGCKGYSQFREITEFQEQEEIEPGIAYLMLIVAQTIKDGLGLNHCQLVPTTLSFDQ